LSRLTPEAEQLVRAGRSVLRPSDADRERVLEGLLPRVGESPGTEQGMAELSRAPAAARLTLVKISSVLFGLGIAGGGLFLALRSEPPANPGAAVSVAVPPANTAAAAPEQLALFPPEEVAAPAPEPLGSPVSQRRGVARESAASKPRAQSARRVPTRPRSEDSLAREVALLSRAGVELHAARPAAALEALDEHERQFPKGVLAQERAAARARALCALGRMQEAQAELERLTRAAPGSPHAARAAQACASAPVKRD
jgi:hypothetical protein